MADTSSPGPVTTGVEPCRLLRCKEMFIDTGEAFNIRNTGSGIYWCGHTQTCLGPDGQTAEPDTCKAGRTCFEAL